MLSHERNFIQGSLTMELQWMQHWDANAQKLVSIAISINEIVYYSIFCFWKHLKQNNCNFYCKEHHRFFTIIYSNSENLEHPERKNKLHINKWKKKKNQQSKWLMLLLPGGCLERRRVGNTVKNTGLAIRGCVAYFQLVHRFPSVQCWSRVSVSSRQNELLGSSDKSSHTHPDHCRWVEWLRWSWGHHLGIAADRNTQRINVVYRRTCFTDYDENPVWFRDPNLSLVARNNF